MRTKKEIQELVEIINGLIETINKLRPPTLTKMTRSNLESFRDILLWVLGTDL